jgi:DNA-binding MarR family transcriptional regulator
MSPDRDPSVADQIIAELGPFMAHQRHKWAAQCQAYGLSMTHFQVLTILDAEGPTPMSRLADELGVTDSNVTGIVGRLEERGVVARVHDAADRRMVRAQLTDAGAQMLHILEQTRMGYMRQLVEQLTTDEQGVVLDALKTLSAAHGRMHDLTAHDQDEQGSPVHPDKELLPTS